MTPKIDPRLTDPFYLSRLFPRYDQLREEAPIHRLTMPDDSPLWLVSGYDNVMAVLNDRRFVMDIRNALTPEERASLPETPAWLEPFERSLIGVDPPDHTRLRRLAQPAFSPRLLEALRPRIQAATDDLIEQAMPRRRMEVRADFAFPLTTTVIADFLGFPIDDRERIASWTDALSLLYFDAAEVERPLTEFTAYLRELFVEKRARPTADVIGELVRFEEAGDRLSEVELVSLVLILIGAGFETTMGFLTVATLLLLEHPDQLLLLRHRPDLIDSAVEELLRQGAAGGAAQRFASEDIELAGVTIPRAEPVMVLPAAANFDPGRFPDPGMLDLAREDNRHLSFGHGLHKCLGAPLARLEGQVALATLLRRLPGLRLADEPGNPGWEDEFPFMRVLKSLVVVF